MKNWKKWVYKSVYLANDFGIKLKNITTFTGTDVKNI